MWRTPFPQYPRRRLSAQATAALPNSGPDNGVPPVRQNHERTHHRRSGVLVFAWPHRKVRPDCAWRRVMSYAPGSAALQSG